ncbi:MAG: hypothetical protein EKK62_03225 [Acidimicrobiia bacterium]|nr:MAG: hypothetical protein EKK62_03225 [Acidimicrobiia bacterium]
MGSVSATSVTLTETDQWVTAPEGHGPSEPILSAIFRKFHENVNDRVFWLFNRLSKGLLGTFSTFAGGAVNTGTDRITIASHGIADNTLVRYGNIGGTAMTATGMLVPSIASLSITPLYVRVVDADTIQLALTSGGSGIDLTGAGSGTHYLFQIPAALDLIMHPSFTNGAGNTIPAGSLRATLAASFAALSGATFTGAVVHSGTVTHSNAVTHNNQKTTYSGAGAYKVNRTAALNDAATQTYSGYGADMLYIPNVSQNSTYTISDPPEAGIGPIRYSRRNVGSGFAVALRRADASLIATLPDTGASWVDLWSHEQDGALMWHVAGHGGNATNID